MTSGTVYSLCKNGTTFFAGTLNNGIYSSSNFGVNWAQTSLNNKTIKSFAVVNNNIFAGTQGSGIYISTNNGSTWSQTGNSTEDVNAMAADNGYIYAGTAFHGVFISSNNGANWIQYFNNTKVNSIHVSYPNIIIGTKDQGVYVSTNNGTNWTQRNQGLGNQNVKGLVVFNNNVYAATYGSAIWKRGFTETIGIRNISSEIPSSYSLYQNYPNPFNPVTKIKFSLPSNVKSETSNVKLDVYDILGKEIATLVDEQLPPGSYEVTFDGSDYASGVYFYKLKAGDYSNTKRMLLVK